MSKLARKKSAPKTLTPSQFWRLSAEKRRILVAEDVIKQVKSGKLSPRSGFGAFFIVEYEDDEHYSSSYYSSSARFDRDSLRMVKSCKVCGLGACLVSAVMLGNDLRIKNDTTLDKFFPFLKRIFSDKTLALIEIAFESGRGAFTFDDDSSTSDTSPLMYNGVVSVYGISSAEYGAALHFAAKYKGNDETTLIAIMNDIIKNKGEFVPQYA